MKIAVTFESAEEMSRFNRFCALEGEDADVDRKLSEMELKIAKQEEIIESRHSRLEQLKIEATASIELRRKLDEAYIERREVEKELELVRKDVLSMGRDVELLKGQLERFGRQKAKYEEAIKRQTPRLGGDVDPVEDATGA